MSALQHVSLFSGVGGIDLAAQRAGIHTAAVCEIDKAALGVLAHKYPGTHLFRDVKEVTGARLRALGLVPARTLLSAGFPCQDLSVAGRRRGMVEGSGTRSALYWEVDRILAEFAPAWVILENVPGLLSSRRGRDMGTVLASLGQRGYGFAYRVLDARHFGVPQRRRRVVIVGRLGDDGRAPAQVLLEPEGVPGNPAARITPRQVFARRFEVGARACGVLGGHAHALTAAPASEDGTGRGTPIVTVPALTTRSSVALDDQQVGQLVVAPATAATLTAGTSRPGVSTPGRRQEDDHNIVAFHMTQDPISGPVSPALGAKSSGMGVGYVAKHASTPQVPRGGWRIDAETAAGGHLIATYQKVTRPQTSDHPDVWEERDVAATLSPFDLGSEGRSVDIAVEARDGELIVRRLTPTECERLQGFPDGHTVTSQGKPQADAPRYKQMGNAVAVPVFEWVTRRIVAVDAESVKAVVA